MKNLDTDLSFVSEGTVEISEREGDKSPFNSVLLAESNGDIDFRICLLPSDEREDDNTELYRINISKYHIECEETSRAFHATSNVILTREKLIVLRSYIDFLLSSDFRSR